MLWLTWLVEIGSISAAQQQDAEHLAKIRSMPLPNALLALGYVEPRTITQAFAVQVGSPQINFYENPISEEVVRTIPELVARDFEVCPVGIIQAVLWYATPHISDVKHRDRLCGILNRDMRPMWAPREWVWQAERERYSICRVTASGSAWFFSRYNEGDWLLMAGNRYQDYLASRHASR